MMSYNEEKGYYETTAYVYNLRSMRAIAIIKGSEEKVQAWIDQEYVYQYDTEKTGTAYDIDHLDGINKSAKTIDLEA